MQETYQDYEKDYNNNNVEDCLYGWVFHYNPMLRLWNAIPRDRYTNYWNESEDENVLKSTQISTLVDLILKIQNSGLDLHKL
jgi:hypothetical protein